MAGGLFKRQKSLEELEEENEVLEAEDKQAGLKLSIAQKRELVKRLKDRGLTPAHFGNTSLTETWTKIIQWLKSH